MNKNWEYKKIGKVMSVERGGSPRPIQKYLTDSEDGLNWIKISDATASDKYIYETKQKITKDGLHKTRLVKEGDFILSNSMSFGRPYIMKTTGCIHDGWLVLKAKEAGLLDSDFLYHLLGSPYIFEQFDKLAAGSTVRNLNIGLVSSVPIPIPPLQEQQQIVAILDNAFKAIDQAKANIEKNIENAKELFQSKLNDIFSQKGDGWEEKTLGEVAKYDKTKYLATNRPYVGLENIESNTGIFLGSLEAQKVKSSTFQFDERHVLYGRLRPYLNKVLVPKFAGHCSTEIFPILPNNKVLREFLFYWLMSPLTVSKIDATWTGARMPRANMNEVIKFKINITSLENQKKIIKELTLLNHEVKNLELKYKNQINNMEELKRSILQKAFAGELTNKEVLV